MSWCWKISPSLRGARPGHWMSRLHCHKKSDGMWCHLSMRADQSQCSKRRLRSRLLALEQNRTGPSEEEGEDHLHLPSPLFNQWRMTSRNLSQVSHPGPAHPPRFLSVTSGGIRGGKTHRSGISDPHTADLRLIVSKLIRSSSSPRWANFPSCFANEGPSHPALQCNTSSKKKYVQCGSRKNYSILKWKKIW